MLLGPLWWGTAASHNANTGVRRLLPLGIALLLRASIPWIFLTPFVRWIFVVMLFFCSSIAVRWCVCTVKLVNLDDVGDCIDYFPLIALTYPKIEKEGLARIETHQLVLQETQHTYWKGVCGRLHQELLSALWTVQISGWTFASFCPHSMPLLDA